MGSQRLVRDNLWLRSWLLGKYASTSTRTSLQRRKRPQLSDRRPPTVLTDPKWRGRSPRCWPSTPSALRVTRRTTSRTPTRRLLCVHLPLHRLCLEVVEQGPARPTGPSGCDLRRPGHQGLLHHRDPDHRRHREDDHMEMYIGQLGLENEYLQTEVRKIQMSNRSQTELIQLMRKRQGQAPPPHQPRPQPHLQLPEAVFVTSTTRGTSVHACSNCGHIRAHGQRRLTLCRDCQWPDQD